MGFREVYSVDEVLRLIREGAVLVDVRSRESYAKEHIAGAVNVPLEEIDERLGEPPRDKVIVVYCGSRECNASYLAARKLAARGYTNVVRFVPGLKGWKEAGLPTEAS